MVNRSPTAVRGGESSRRDGDFGQLMPDSQKKKASRGRKRAVEPRMGKPASTAERVSDLAWAGQHAQAIELATAALAAAGLSVGSRLDRQAAEKPPIKIGIGIASGEMVAGYTGTNQRATYTCIGDTVNLAARLETRTKVAQRAILIDQATRSALSERITVEPLGLVPFKGKAAAVDVFSVDSGQQR